MPTSNPPFCFSSIRIRAEEDNFLWFLLMLAEGSVKEVKWQEKDQQNGNQERKVQPIKVTNKFKWSIKPKTIYHCTNITKQHKYGQDVHWAESSRAGDVHSLDCHHHQVPGGYHYHPYQSSSSVLYNHKVFSDGVELTPILSCVLNMKSSSTKTT